MIRKPFESPARDEMFIARRFLVYLKLCRSGIRTLRSYGAKTFQIASQIPRLRRFKETAATRAAITARAMSI